MTDHDWLRWPETCAATVTRAGEEDACGKVAIAVALYRGDEYEPHAYPVCKHHARGRDVMSLTKVIANVRTDEREQVEDQIRADERERIAQAMPEAWADRVERDDGTQYIAVADAVRIAWEGGSDE